MIFFYTLLAANYGYTINDILKCYWKKWQRTCRELGRSGINMKLTDKIIGI